jgi:hypothetical protein
VWAGRSSIRRFRRPPNVWSVRIRKHMFCAPRETTLTGREQTTIRAADLAERLVDQISEAGQDWAKIELHARELLELVAKLRSMSSQPATGA